MEPQVGRRCHNALNPLHSLIYFAPEAEEEFASIGLAKGRMGYFAGRAAAMGPVRASVVVATFYNFSPALVARHIPAAWEIASPDAILAARTRAVDAVLRRLLGADTAGSAEVREAAELARIATRACAAPGRVLYAAHAALSVPDPDETPHLAMWHAITLLREHRGDGHLMALAGAGLDGVEALFTHTATGRGFTPGFALASRGWTESEWASAGERLAARGLVTPDGTLTADGAQLRRTIEERTDALASAPYEHLGEPGVARLTEIGRRLTERILTAGAFPAGVFA